MNHKLSKSLLLGMAGLIISSQSIAQTATQITVRIENVAPLQGTFQTPVWVGLHDGTFDAYNGGTPANSLPNPAALANQGITSTFGVVGSGLNALGQGAMEAICEDGNTAQIAADFAFLNPNGQDATVAGPEAPSRPPLAPGEFTEFSFTVSDPSSIDNRYFSYASMILPSNDFCIANGNPRAHQLFNEAGEFIATSFFVQGIEALDAGTEVDDEIPANTAFFGQAAPNTGVVQNGNIGTIGRSDVDGTGFIAPNSNDSAVTILEDPRFVEGNFNVPGYSFLKFTFTQSPVIDITDELRFRSILLGRNEVPAVRTRAIGLSYASLINEGSLLEVLASVIRLPANDSITVAHLHLAPEGANGPVVADLLEDGPVTPAAKGRIQRIAASLESSSLVGPLAGQSLSDLIREIQAGNIYVNIHSEQSPAGLIRGQLKVRPQY